MTTAPEGRVLPAAGVALPSDRRYRRSDLRPDRRRIGRRVARVGVWVLLGLGLAAGGGWAFDWVLRADALTVRAVQIRGNTRLSTGEIDLLLQGLRGENILQVNFDEYRRRLLDSPWIAGATFRRALPSTIDIQVIERVPLAIARLQEQLFLVDDAGVIIDEYGAPYGDLDLPVVDGLFATPSGHGPLMDPERVQLISRLLGELAGHPELPRRLSQADASNPHDVVVMFDAYPIWLHLGEARFVERLQAFFEVAPTLQERFVEIDSIDLRFDNRMFVRPHGAHDRGRRPAGQTSSDRGERPAAGRGSEDVHGA